VSDFSFVFERKDDRTDEENPAGNTGH